MFQKIRAGAPHTSTAEVIMNWSGPILAALLVALFCGCSLAPEPQIVYQADEPDLNTSSDQPLPGLDDGDHAIVALANGDRFEAKYRGTDEGIVEFADVEWEDGERAPSLSCALDEVSEIRRQDWGTADTVVAWTSIAVAVVAIAVYGRGDG